MGYSKLNQKWQSDLCQSELLIEKVAMKCTCNAFEADQIGLFSDFIRTLGEPVTFPRIEFEEDKQLLTVVTPTVDPEFSNVSGDSTVQGNTDQKGGVSDTQERVTSAIEEINGTNYVWMGETILIAILCLAGSLITIKMDRKDAASQGISRTSPLAITAQAQNHFIDEVAKELKENYAQVCLRQQSLLHYRTIFSKSSFPHLLS